MDLDRRWAIHVDVEGFGALYEQSPVALVALRNLMEGIYFIGSRCYPESPDRLFAHQIGDGFIIVSEFGAAKLDVAVGITVALMRHVALGGGVVKAAIAEGCFADIQGCYPDSIRSKTDEAGCVRMGSGLMTTFPVMGTALINSVKLAERSPSGALLTIPASELPRVPAECLTKVTDDPEVASLDWVHSQFQTLETIQEKACLKTPAPEAIRNALVGYINVQKPKEVWKANSNWFLGLGVVDSVT